MKGWALVWVLELCFCSSCLSNAAQCVSKELPVLILGSGGLVGRPLVKDLKTVGYSIIEVTGRKDLDLRIPGSLEERFRDVELGFVFFLAWDVGGSGYIFGSDDSQAGQIRSNAAIMLHTMTWLEDHKLPFIYTGSSMELIPNGGSSLLSAYAEVKRMCTAWALRLPNARTVRLWNIYGPVPDAAERSERGRAHVVTDWVHKCLSHSRLSQDGKKHSSIITVHARTDGREERQLLFSPDASTMLIRTMEISHAFSHDQVIDLASGEWTSLQRLAKVVEETLDHLHLSDSSVPSCKIVFPPIPAGVAKTGEPELNRTSIILAKIKDADKNWESTSLGDGIKATIENYLASARMEDQVTVSVKGPASTAGASVIPSYSPEVLNPSSEAPSDFSDPIPRLPFSTTEIWSLIGEAQNLAKSGVLDMAMMRFNEAIANVTMFGLRSENGQNAALAHSALYNDLGLTLMWLGRLDEAMMCFITSLWIDPWSKPAFDNLGHITELQKPDEAVVISRMSIVGNAFLYTPTHLAETARNDVADTIVYKPDALRLMALALVRVSEVEDSASTLLSEDFAVLVQLMLIEMSNDGNSDDSYAELFMCGLHHMRIAQTRQQPPFKNMGAYRWYEAQLTLLRSRVNSANVMYGDSDFVGCEDIFASGYLPTIAEGSEPQDRDQNAYVLLIQEGRLMSRMGRKREALVLFEGAISSRERQGHDLLANDLVFATEVSALRKLNPARSNDENITVEGGQRGKATPQETHIRQSAVDIAIQHHVEATVSRSEDKTQEEAREMFLVAAVNKNIGLGNRLLSLVGALALSVATRRTLLIQWPEEYRYGMKSSRLSDLFDFPQNISRCYDPLALSESLGIPLQNIPSMSSYLEIFHNQEENGKNQRVFETLACDNLRETRGGNATFLHLHTNQDISAILRYNRHLPWAMEEEAFSKLAQALIRPCEKVRAAGEAWLDAVTRRMNGHNGGNNFNYMSLHIRLGIAGHDVIGGKIVTQDDVDRNRNTTLMEAIRSADVVMSNLQQNRQSVHVASSGDAILPSFVFLATDDAIIRSAAADMLQEQLGIPAAAYDDSLVPQTLRLGGGLPLVAVDFFLISRGQHVLRREFSTFSMVAGAVGGVIPYLFVPCGPAYHASTERAEGLNFSVFQERHSSGRLGTNLHNLERSPAACYGNPGSLARKMADDGFLYPSCSEYKPLPATVMAKEST